MTKIHFVVAVTALGLMQVSYLSPVRAQPIPTECQYESGIIRPSGDMRSGALKGPILVLSLQTDVDPAAPKKAWTVWSRDNTWISVDDFKGPLFLAKEEMLMGRPDFMSRGAVYSGCRM